MDEAVVETNEAPDAVPYDGIVVGAGICGVIFLKYALERGLRCLVLEKQDAVGGLWNRLPAWQDIQNRREDFAVDDVPLGGVRQPQIVEHVRDWVRRFDLGSSIRLGCEVISVTWTGESWQVRTRQGTFRARHLIVASGLQSRPWIPEEVERQDSSVLELHSSELRRPEELRGRRVTIVGGGASALDLLDLALENGAESIDWVYRHLRWFLPTTGAKQRMWPNLRTMATVQAVVSSPETMSANLQGLVEAEYDYFGLSEIKPQVPFDVREHQLIPGRSRMIRDFDLIRRHRGEIRRIEGDEAVLAQGERIATDILLWGTGYRTDLSYLDLDEFRHVVTLDALLPKLGSLVRSIENPNLFFVGMSLIQSTSTTAFFAAVEARSIVSHMLGETEIPTTNVPHQITHWHLLRHFAQFDHANYPRFLWRLRYVLLAWWYALARNRSLDLRPKRSRWSLGI